MSEKVKKEKPKGPGSPKIKDIQYWDWFSELRPFLEEGYSLNMSIDKAGLNKHRTSIYKNYRDNKDYSNKIDSLIGLIGEYSNLIANKTLKKIHTKLVETNGDYQMTREELQIWKTVAEKHRTAQPFFVNRTEEAEAKEEDFGKVVDRVPVIEYIVPKDEPEKENKENPDASNTAQPNPEATSSVETPNQPNN